MATPFGLSAVFLNVLLEQLGLPLPAVPILVVAGALAADGRLPALGVGAAAVLACALGDCGWYLAGRRYGARVMRLLCRISLTPDICVSQTQTHFERWGARALIVAKFVPGLSMVAPPLAGATRMPVRRFLAFSVLGSSLWVTVWLLGGVLLKPEIDRLLPYLTDIGGIAILVLLVLLGLYIAFKWWERRRFYTALDMARISVAELHEQLQRPLPPLIVDVRSATALAIGAQRIPGALHVPLHDVASRSASLPRDRDVILYCACPNEASAAQAARLLMNRGIRRVRPLRGGLEAWIEAGYEIEELSTQAVSGASATLVATR